jgi:hypothetical protein
MPRLTIRHLLICTAICSLYVWRAKALGGLSPSSSIISVLSVVVGGMTLAAAAYVIFARWRGLPWKSTEPGHWFALVALWELVESPVTRFVMIWTGAIDDRNVWVCSTEVGRLFTSIAYVGIAAILLAGLCLTKWPLYWRVPVAIHFLDATNAAVWRISSASEALQWLHLPDDIYIKSLPVFGILATVALAIAIYFDIYKKDFRTWPHWIGLTYELLHWYWIIKAYSEHLF